MQNGVHRGGEHGTGGARLRPLDAIRAIVAVEAMQVTALDRGLFAGAATPLASATNAFGDPVALLEDAPIEARVARARERAARGERVGFLAGAGDLLTVRAALVTMAEERLAVVCHAIEAPGQSHAYALAELGWGVLFASGVGESIDLTLVARRAAEDSGTPFLVVHELASSRRVEPLGLPDGSLVEAFVGPASSRLRAAADPGHPAHARVSTRAFAERVPFALASAMRELDSLTGRKLDVVTRSPAGHGAEAPFVLVGVGSLGDVLLGEVPRLRAEGHDVGAVKLTALRPFPGPRVVRLLARAHAITVVEHVDAPLAQSNPVTRDVKSAFADALTWAPDYPGIGRIPRVHSGVYPTGRGLGTTDVDALVRNMAAGEHGKRFFVLGGDRELDLERAPRGAARPSPTAGAHLHVQGVVADDVTATRAAEILASALARSLSLRVRASIHPRGASAGARASFDLSASHDRPLGVHGPDAVGLVVLDDLAPLVDGNPLARLAFGGTLAIPSGGRSPEALWALLPAYVKAIVFDREARVVGFDAAASSDGGEDASWVTAAAIAGVVLATFAEGPDGAPRVDASLVEREIEGAVHDLAGRPVARAGSAARRAFDGGGRVPREVVARDEEAVRLGRKDARSSVA